MTTGTISKWSIESGSAFSAGDVICEIETDKASIDFEAQDDGILAKILKDGDDAKDLDVGTPICVIVEEESDVAAFQDYVAEGSASSGGEDVAEVSAAASEPAAAPTEVTVSKENLLMPSARHLSQSKGLDATGLPGTGKGGRILKGDVLLALKNGVEMPPLQTAATATTTAAAAAPTPAAVKAPAPASISTEVNIPSITSSGTYEDISNNNMRKIIARRLTESKSTVPHFYATTEIELDNIMALRKKLAAKDIKVSVNDLIIRGSALALRDVPEVNASFIPQKGGGGDVVMNNTVDISVAVATPGGLITPIVPNTDELGLTGISDKVRDLATRARDGKLQPEEYQGGTFCISNLGMFGISEFSAVINPPQAAILAVGGGIKKVVVNTPYVDDAEEQEKPTVKSVMSARLSADRRVVDEATVGLFLSALKCYLNKPELLLL